MSGRNKKVILWCGTGGNQRALANKIAERFELCGILIDHKVTAKRVPFIKRAWSALQDRIFFKTILNAWFSMLQRYSRQYPEWPVTALKNVDSINSDEAFEFTRQFSPGLIIVSGTSLVKSKMLSANSSIGIINLHTGLSPYIKGGPNCTNWCIATAQYEKIGNTIMWINEGIDSGNIITTELTPLQSPKDLADIHWQVMEHAHTLYIRSIQYLLTASPPYQSVLQKDIAKGELYLTRMWDFNAKKKLLANLPALLKEDTVLKTDTVITVPLKETQHGS